MAKERRYFLKICRKSQVLLYNACFTRVCSKLYCKALGGYIIDIKNPKTFTEKMQWLTLYEWPNNPLVVQGGDKYTFRCYLDANNLGAYLNEFIRGLDNERLLSEESAWFRYVYKE
jgi:hypothetical protein